MHFSPKDWHTSQTFHHWTNFFKSIFLENTNFRLTDLHVFLMNAKSLFMVVHMNVLIWTMVIRVFVQKGWSSDTTERLAIQTAVLTTTVIMVACLRMGRQHVSVRKNRLLIAMGSLVLIMMNVNTRMVFANSAVKIKLVVSRAHAQMDSTLTQKIFELV